MKETSGSHKSVSTPDAVNDGSNNAGDKPQSAAALRESEAKCHGILDNLPEGCQIIGFDWQYLYVNKTFAAQGRMNHDSFPGHTVMEVYPWMKDSVILTHLQTCMTQRTAATLQEAITWPDGTRRWFNFVIQPIREGLLILTNDITEKKKEEEELRYAQKMEAIGRLTAGIAHDFNNLLNIITGYAETIKERLDPQDPFNGPVDRIMAAGGRAADLIRQLMAFSRKQIIQPRVVSLNSIVDSIQGMLRRTIGENIALEIRINQDLWMNEVDPTQIEQVVLNLAINARDAMPDGGRLVIETANVHLDEATQYICPGAERGDYVCMTVRDTGVGMKADVKSHIFEPFFTTRGPGRGTGLGLSTVYGIVKQHAGHVYVDSEPGEGSTFRLYFPRSMESPSGDESAETHPLAPSGTETILLVEDDQDLRSYVAMVLRERGYEVVQATSGEEALQIVEGYDGVIHLVLTDVIMPGISGRILAEKLTAVHPGLKVLFMSGYPNDSLAHHGVLRPGIALLQKPFTGVKVLEKIRELLDGA